MARPSLPMTRKDALQRDAGNSLEWKIALQHEGTRRLCMDRMNGHMERGPPIPVWQFVESCQMTADQISRYILPPTEQLSPVTREQDVILDEPIVIVGCNTTEPHQGKMATTRHHATGTHEGNSKVLSNGIDVEMQDIDPRQVSFCDKVRPPFDDPRCPLVEEKVWNDRAPSLFNNCGKSVHSVESRSMRHVHDSSVLLVRLQISFNTHP